MIREKRRGKGFVMQTILETVDGDVCVIVDGDDTYFAEDVHTLLAPVQSDRADMVVGDRLRDASSAALNDLHRFGNRAILAIINLVFRTRFRDVLSGYRVMNRNFLRTVPLITGGFETETELTLQALEKGMVIEEVPIRYRARPSRQLLEAVAVRGRLPHPDHHGRPAAQPPPAVLLHADRARPARRGRRLRGGLDLRPPARLRDAAPTRWWWRAPRWRPRASSSSGSC